MNVVATLLAVAVGAATLLQPRPPSQEPAPDYATAIAPILNKRCVSCHSESQVAPFSLVGYENAKKFAPTIAYVTEKRSMPPWKADAHYGEFRDVPTLTDLEISAIRKWADAGAPEGDRSKTPPAPMIAAGWRLGKPDLILAASKATKIPAEGSDFYRDYLIDPKIKKPTWIRAVEFRPSGKNTVHHVIPMVLAKDQARKLRRIKFDFPEDESWKQSVLENIESDKTLGFWSTGAPPFEVPGGTAYLLNPGDCIVLDMHFKPTGKVEEERTQVGLYFMDQPAATELEAPAIANEGTIYVEPEKADQKFYCIEKLRAETTIYAIWPHMHYLGRKFKAWAIRPDKKEVPLVSISDWDPDWQLLYFLKEPIALPKDSKIYLSGTYDNTTGNPRNPNSPPIAVESGPASKDEMLFATLYVTTKKDPPPTPPKRPNPFDIID